MKTFQEQRKAIRSDIVVTTIFALVAAVVMYFTSRSLGEAVALFLAVTFFNLCMWHLKAGWRWWTSLMIQRQRTVWEASMLNTLKMANEAESYHRDDPNVLSAYHNAVGVRRAEGVKMGYLDLGRL